MSQEKKETSRRRTNPANPGSPQLQVPTLSHLPSLPTHQLTSLGKFKGFFHLVLLLSSAVEPTKNGELG